MSILVRIDRIGLFLWEATNPLDELSLSVMRTIEGNCRKSQGIWDCPLKKLESIKMYRGFGDPQFWACGQGFYKLGKVYSYLWIEGKEAEKRLYCWKKKGNCDSVSHSLFTPLTFSFKTSPYFMASTSFSLWIFSLCFPKV